MIDMNASDDLPLSFYVYPDRRSIGRSLVRLFRSPLAPRERRTARLLGRPATGSVRCGPHGGNLLFRSPTSVPTGVVGVLLLFPCSWLYVNATEETWRRPRRSARSILRRRRRHSRNRILFQPVLPDGCGQPLTRMVDRSDGWLLARSVRPSVRLEELCNCLPTRRSGEQENKR